MYKKSSAGTAFSLEALIVVIIMLILFTGGMFAGGAAIHHFRTDKLKSECVTIDHALEMYSLAHKTIKSSTAKIDPQNKDLKYEKGRKYPANLEELGIVSDKFGYFSTEIDLKKFQYKTMKSTTDNSMTYELGVTLPNGIFYRSPGSNKDGE